MIFMIRHYGATEAPRGAKTAPGRPKMASRRPQDEPRRPQDDSKRASWRPKMAQEGPKRDTRGLQEGPQQGSKRGLGTNLAERPLQDPLRTLRDPPGTPPQRGRDQREGASLSITITTSFFCFNRFRCRLRSISRRWISKSIELTTISISIDSMTISRRQPQPHADKSADLTVYLTTGVYFAVSYTHLTLPTNREV